LDLGPPILTCTCRPQFTSHKLLCTVSNCTSATAGRMFISASSLSVRLLFFQLSLLLLATARVKGMSLSSTTSSTKYFIGFDLGTSGCRISIITKDNDDSTYKEVHSDATLYTNYDDPSSWTSAIDILLRQTPSQFLNKAKSICVSGTSASCLLVDPETEVVSRSPKMYDYDITHTHATSDAGAKAKECIDKFAPLNHATRANTSALSKLLHYHYCSPIKSSKTTEGKSDKDEVLAHQSEYAANLMFLSKPEYVSDWHNALKLGYDVKELKYPSWLKNCLAEVGISEEVLPQVVAPGQSIGTISKSCHEKYGIPEDAVVVGGTTDSNAAFVAAAVGGSGGGLPSYGTAVTSLGSTLAIKLLSRSFVEDSSTGVYSHRFPVLGSDKNVDADGTKAEEAEEAWLVGGASNVGCAVLRQENFSNEELAELSQDMDISTDSPFSYYPLTKKGERFPLADGNKKPVLEPKPESGSESRSEYLKGILQGISSVEQMGFEVLGKLGANPSFPTVVMTCGGGAKNDAWLQMRQRLLRQSSNKDGDTTEGVNVLKAENAEASFGAAILAASQFS